MSRLSFVLIASIMIFSASCDYTNPPTPDENNGGAGPFRIGVAENSELCGFANIRRDSFHPYYSCLHLYLNFETLAEIIGANESSAAIRISDDGKECAITLPKGIYFDDGSELTADDVMNSLDEMNKARASDIGKFLIVPMSDMTAVKRGPYDVVFKSKYPRRFFQEMDRFPIIGKNSRKLFTINGMDIRAPSGAGPYLITSVDVKNRKILMERNKRYRSAPPKIEKIELAFFNNLEHAAMGLLGGEVDYVPVFGDMEKEMVMTGRNLRLLRYRSHYGSALLLNTKSAKLKDARLRRALSMLIDRQALSKSHRGLPETRVPTSSLLNFSYPETEPSADAPDTETALRLLREAGCKRVDGKFYRNGKPLELEISILGLKDAQYVMEAIRSVIKDWEDAGIYCSYKSVSVSEIMSGGGFEVLFTQMNDSDLNRSLNLALNSSGEGGIFDLDFHDKQLDGLREEFRKETRESVLREKKSAILSRLKETVPFIPLYYDYGFAALGARLSGDEKLVAALSKNPGSMGFLHEYR